MGTMGAAAITISPSAYIANRKKRREALLRGAMAHSKDRWRRMAGVEARYGGSPSPQILRAYENLKTAL